MPPHPIFGDIERGDLEAVQQHVLADPMVLEERTPSDKRREEQLKTEGHENKDKKKYIIQMTA